ncbi:MAG TPA: hypothetical protein H9909_13830 [Candidatus Mediterraneibacter norfolkensis]|nr:hypothetical protein [Candidatus Mediterraneibacter norfolkensis]
MSKWEALCVCRAFFLVYYYDLVYDLDICSVVLTVYTGGNMEKNTDFFMYSMHDEEQKRLSNQRETSYIAFLDILGFKNMVIDDIEKVILTLRQVRGFCVSSYGYAKNERGTRNEIEQDNPAVTMFSDSIVISAPVWRWYLHEFVDLISNLQFFLLVNGVLIRGGIDIGEVFHDENYVFGKGIVDAYLIESHISKYPRIVVSNRALRYSMDDLDESFDAYIADALKWSNKLDMVLDGVEELYIHDIFEYITRDKHGIYYLEYLMKGARESDDETLPEDLSAIRNTIDEGLLSHDESVKEKYIWLDHYFNRVYYNDSKFSITEQDEYNKEEERLKKIFKNNIELADAFERGN